MHEVSRFDSVAQHYNRRRVVAGLATLAAGGAGLSALGHPARASVSIDSWTVPDASFEAEAVAPVADATIAYAFDVGSDTAVRALAFELLVDGHAVASDELVTETTSLENTTTLSGALTDSGAWSTSDFDVAVGESVAHDVTVAVRFAVVGTDESEIVTARAEDTATVTVAHPQQTEYTASVGGEVAIRDDSA